MLRTRNRLADVESDVPRDGGAGDGGAREGGAREGGDSLERWLADGYAPAYRTAFLILRNPSDAEEAVQEAFLRAWRFRAAIPAGDGIRPWLYRVVVNACLSKLRSDRGRRKHADAFSDLAGLVAEDGPDPEAFALRSDAQGAVLDALARLPEHLRVVVVLRYYAQLSEREIASAIHRRPGTVKSRLHDAKRILGSDPHLSAYVPAGATVGATTGGGVGPGGGALDA